MLCAALSASAQPALLRPRGAAQPATTHRTASVPSVAAAGRASRCATPLAADVNILRSYSSSRTSVRVAASAEEPAASSPSSPDVRSSEQQQPTPASGGDDAAELRRRVTDSEGRMEELGAAKGQWAGDVGRRLFVFGAFTTTLTACVAVVPAAGQQLYQQAREQQPGAAETAAAVGVCAVGSTPGPYPGIRLPRTSPIPGQVVTLDNVCVGLVVRRGPDWDKIYTNFMEAGVDGGPGNDGVVTNVSKTGRYASVRWNATGETSYSCNITGMPGYHELVVAPAEAQRRKWPWEWVWRKQ